jgi:hypothetical protein
VIFFLDDLHNFLCPGTEGIALTLRDQFQEFAVHGFNYSLCFSAHADYFSEIRAFAEPAVRFYDKVHLASFTPAETQQYAAAVFGDSAPIHHLSEWLHGKTLGHPLQPEAGSALRPTIRVVLRLQPQPQRQRCPSQELDELRHEGLFAFTVVQRSRHPAEYPDDCTACRAELARICPQDMP